MRLNLKASRKSLMNTQNKILPLSETCHLRLERSSGQDICSRRLLDLFISSPRQLLQRMSCRHNLLVIIPLDWNSRSMSSGSSVPGAKTSKGQKQAFKPPLSFVNPILVPFMLTSISQFSSLSARQNAWKGNTSKFQKLPGLFCFKRSSSRCTSMNSNMSWMNTRRSLERSSRLQRICFNLI